jgi:hypothetical protein
MSDIMNWLVENQSEIILWFFTVMALLGSYFNATMRWKLSYMIWFWSNFYFVWHNFAIGEKQQGTLFVFYLITAVLGIRSTIHQKGWLKRASIDR